jgi:hypothetical protein
MATQPKARDTVYSTVRPEFIYLGLEMRVPSTEESAELSVEILRDIEVGDF